MSPLAGKRILVVEDEALISAMLEYMLAGIGMQVVGPATTIHSALQLAGEESLDVAVLDVNVRGQHIEPVVKVLAAKGVPMLFATGYGNMKLPDGSSAVVVDKPYTLENLMRELGRIMIQADRAATT